MLNVNAGANGNPLDALLAQNNGNLWGNLGGLLYGRYNITTNGGLAEDGSRTIPDGLITENDPRYQQLQSYLDKNDLTQLRNTNVGGPGGVIDPSKVTYDPQYGLLTSKSNLTPLGETFLDKYGPWLMMAAAAGGIAAEGAGLIGGGAEAGAGAAGSGSVIGTNGTTGAFDVGGSTGFGGSTALDGGEALAANPGNYAPVVEHSVNSVPVVEHSFNSAGGLLGNLSAGNFGEAASQVGSWAMSHPLQAAGLLQTGYGLVHGSSKPGASSGGSKGGNGNGPAGNFNVPQQQFYMNPYIAAQIQRGYGR